MKYRWTLSDLVFPQDQGLLTERLTDRFQPLSEVAQRYRLEAKYLLAGEIQPYSSIVLAYPHWSDQSSLEQVVFKLEQEYGCPVILIGTDGRGIVKPDRSFLLEQVSSWLKEWHKDGKFVVQPQKIDQVIDRWRKFCRPYRSSYTNNDLKIEAIIPYDRVMVRELNTLYQTVAPFMTERPLFCLSSVPMPREKIVNVKGINFVWAEQKDQAETLKRCQKIDLVFYLEEPQKGKWQGTIVDVEPTRDGRIPV